MTTTGNGTTTLAVIRGNSGSGKSSTARELRARLGRGVAWVEQDNLRRIILREHDVPDGANIGLIEMTARYALDNAYDVILEGILYADHYGAMLERLTTDHVGTTGHYYFDIPFTETIRRHQTRPLSLEVTADQMRDWYRARDLLSFVDETVISDDVSLDEIVDRIVTDLKWTTGRRPE